MFAWCLRVCKNRVHAHVCLRMTEEGDPTLLSDLFDSDAESETVEESVADMIVRVAAGPHSECVTDKWITDDSGSQFYFSSETKKLICYTVEGVYLDYMGSGVYTERAIVQVDDACVDTACVSDTCVEKTFVDDTSVDKTCDETSFVENTCVDKPCVHVWRFSREELSFFGTKRKRFETEDFDTFIEKYKFDESFGKYLKKFDCQLIQYVMERFNPTKAKAKNAIQKYIESLLKDQKWRFVNHTLDEAVFSKNETFELIDGLEILRVESDWFAQIRGKICLVNGIRLSPECGPFGPLTEYSIITLGTTKDDMVPDEMFLIKIGMHEF